MPFQSERQRGFLWKFHPDVAEKFAKETPKGKKLPIYKSKKLKVTVKKKKS